MARKGPERPVESAGGPVYRLGKFGKNYSIYWWDPDQRKTVKRSTGCSDLGDAQAKLSRFLAALGKPVEPKSKTVAAIIDGYLHDRKGVVVDYRRLEEIKVPLVRLLGATLVTDVRPSTSRYYINARRTEGTGDGTINKELRQLRAAFNWAETEEWIEKGKVPTVKVPSPPPPKDRWLTHDEAARLIDACGVQHIRLFVVLALNTAARKGALLDLQWQQVDFLRKRISLNPPGRHQTAKKRAIVPINDVLAEALTEAVQARTCDYVIEWASQPVASIKKGFTAACERAGLFDVTPHTLRHTAASWMAQDGVAIEKISQFLGHTDVTTTRRIYEHHAPDYLNDAAQSLGASARKGSIPQRMESSVLDLKSGKRGQK